MRGYFGFILGLMLIQNTVKSIFMLLTSPPRLSSRAMIEMLLLLGFENHLVL